MDVAATTTVLVVTVVLLVTQWIRVEVTALLAIVALVATSVLTPEEALSGFSSPATITVAAMFMLSAGLIRTGALDWVTAAIGRLSGGRRWRLVVLTGAVAATASAFVNNTPIVVMLVPVALALAKRHSLFPSKLLMPISYFAILGGTCTLVGTSTNILVDALYRQAGGPGFAMFDFTRLGLCFVTAGAAYILAFSGLLLPDRESLSSLLSDRSRSSFVTEVTIPAGSGLIGSALGRSFTGVRVLELIRADEEVVFSPPPDTLLVAEDALLVEAPARDLHELMATRGVEYASMLEDDERVRISRLDLVIAELVITPTSPIVNRKLRHVGLNRKHGVTVLGVLRLGRQHRYKIRDLVLRTGDVLLVQGEARALHALQEGHAGFLVEGVEQTLRFPHKAPLALAIMGTVVALAAFGVLPIAALALGGVVAMILTRCIGVADASASLESSVLLLLAGTIPLGLAIAKTGMAEAAARWLIDLAEPFGPVALVAALYLATSALTEILSNNATAVLLTPIALGIAAATGIDPRPLLMTVAFAASASFATPIGYQTNTIVVGPGGYRFADYLRFGLPLNLILWVTAVIMIPLLWPLSP